ncbi:uncharacterized protein [Antedon mediterranea]
MFLKIWLIFYLYVTVVKCQVINPCYSSPCLNGGACTQLPDIYLCSCLSGYTGTHCEEEVVVSPCSSSPCLNGGTCHQSSTSYFCSCPTAYSGTRCEVGDPCQLDNFCQNGGTCLQTSSSSSLFICQCPSGTSGSLCELAVDCGGLSNIINGEVSYVSGTTFGMSATYTCTTVGYELIGNTTRMCLEDGSWSGSTPSCKVVVYCPCT